MVDDPAGATGFAAVLAELVDDTVRRARNLTPRAWREVTPQAGRRRREVALDLAAHWTAQAQLLEGARVEQVRRPPAPRHDYALADVLAVTGADLVTAMLATTWDVPQLGADVISETDTYRWHLLGAPVPSR